MGHVVQGMAEPVQAGTRRDIVLVVDDAPETLGFLSRALENAGMTVLVAPGGEAAMQLIQRVVPDLILLDAVMPGLDGFETCRALKAGPAARVPVIFMTGLSDTSHVVRGLEAGGVDYVNKPLQLDTLLARIKVHLRNARQARSAQEALDATGRTLLALRADGSVLWHTRESRRLLDGRDAELAAWLADTTRATQPLDLAGPTGPLRLQRVGRLSGDEILVVVEQTGAAGAGSDAQTDETRCARLAERFKLTPREAEVLLWIARGKSNRDAAEILSLSHRTVNKHLEHVFVKLGVESRAAAAAMAMQVLTQA